MSVRKITVHVPTGLLKKAQKETGEGSHAITTVGMSSSAWAFGLCQDEADAPVARLTVTGDRERIGSGRGQRSAVAVFDAVMPMWKARRPRLALRKAAAAVRADRADD